MPLTRRQFIRGTTVAGASLLIPGALVACGGDDEDGATEPTLATGATLGATSAAASPTPAMRGPSKGTITVAENLIPAALDANAGSGGLALMAYGIGETLMRVTADMKVEPWLASAVESTSARNWKVTIRDGATFHDGSPVDGAAVKASLELAMEKSAAVATFLPKGTTITASGNTVDIVTPTDVALMRSNLAAFNLIIQKQSANGMLFTGPFVPSEFVAQASVTLKAYPGYRGGPPRLERINVRYVPDVNARFLALLSGDVDGAAALLPSHVSQLKSAGHQAFSFKFTRTNQVILNVTRQPLDDVVVRRAIAYAIDREAIVKGVLDGSGRVSNSFVPADLGLGGIIETQKYDATQAKKILDAAGWASGNDGIRSKDARRLAFKLGFYASRAELEPMAIVIQDQLKSIGIEATLEKFADINTTVANSEFDATLYSYNPVPYADPGRGITQFYVQSGTNNNRYSNPKVTQLFAEYTQTTDQGKREQVLQEMQRTFGEDVPVVYILAPNQVHGFSKRVKGYTPHPLENYKFDTELTIDG